MFGMVLSVMVYGIILAITGWMLWMTFRNITGFICPVIRAVKTAVPVITRGTRIIARIAIPVARSAARLAAPYMALAARRIATSAAKVQANAAIIKANWQATTRR